MFVASSFCRDEFFASFFPKANSNEVVIFVPLSPSTIVVVFPASPLLYSCRIDMFSLNVYSLRAVSGCLSAINRPVMFKQHESKPFNQIHLYFVFPSHAFI